MYDACVCVDDYDGPSFSTDKVVKARKVHVCGECGKQINPGDKYEYVWGIWDGEQEIHKTCYVCYCIREDLFHCGWVYGQIWEHLQEAWFDACKTEAEREELDFLLGI